MIRRPPSSTLFPYPTFFRSTAGPIGYEHIAALGGLRGRKVDVPPAVNAFWTNQSFHNYADYAMSDEFHAGLVVLRERSEEHTSELQSQSNLVCRLLLEHILR